MRVNLTGSNGQTSESEWRTEKRIIGYRTPPRLTHVRDEILLLAPLG